MLHEIEIKAVNSHYEVFIKGAFYCSCDNYGEAIEEINEWKEEHKI